MICHVASVHNRLFADDCLLYRNTNSHSDHLTLQKDLDSLQTWAENWGMKFNATKCYLMSIQSTKKPSIFEYSLNKHILKKVQDNPYLGVQIIAQILNGQTMSTKYLTKQTV